MDNMIRISELQIVIESLIENYQLSNDLMVRYIDLASEVGEVGKEILTSTNYGDVKNKFSENLCMEIGDVLFSLICLCVSSNVNLEDSIVKALEKYENRFNRNKSIGSEKQEKK